MPMSMFIKLFVYRNLNYIYKWVNKPILKTNFVPNYLVSINISIEFNCFFNIFQLSKDHLMKLRHLNLPDYHQVLNNLIVHS